MTEEVEDALAYRRLLKKIMFWEKPPVSALLVALHNVVTKSIDRKWFKEGRGLTYCYAEVMQQMKQVVTGPEPPTLEGLSQEDLQHVVGLGAAATGQCQEHQA